MEETSERDVKADSLFKKCWRFTIRHLIPLSIVALIAASVYEGTLNILPMPLISANLIFDGNFQLVYVPIIFATLLMISAISSKFSLESLICIGVFLQLFVFEFVSRDGILYPPTISRVVLVQFFLIVILFGCFLALRVFKRRFNSWLFLAECLIVSMQLCVILGKMQIHPFMTQR